MEGKKEIIADIVAIPPKPRAIADVINKGYPKISGGVTSDLTITRRIKDNTIATKTESGTPGTMPDSATCFCDGACDLVGIYGLTAHLMEKHYPNADFDSVKRNIYRLLDKEIEIEGNLIIFPKVRLWKDRGGAWLFCTTSVDYFMEHYKNNNRDTWLKNLSITDVSGGTNEG